MAAYMSQLSDKIGPVKIRPIINWPESLKNRQNDIPDGSLFCKLPYIYIPITMYYIMLYLIHIHTIPSPSNSK